MIDKLNKKSTHMPIKKKSLIHVQSILVSNKPKKVGFTNKFQFFAMCIFDQTNVSM